MNIDGVTTGIVLDHIDAGKSLAIYNLLRLDKLDCSIAIIQNAKSGKYGKKDIIKIDQIIDLDFDLIGFVDPNITVNIIKDSKLHSKKHMKLPERLTNVIQCKNPRCITSTERGIEHRFRLDDAENHIYRCEYCDTVYGIKIVFYLFRKIYRQCICPLCRITCEEGFLCKFIQGLDGLFYKIKSDTIRIIRLFTDNK